MPKKDTASAVLGMLSTAGSQTRPVGEPSAPVAPQPPRPTAPVPPTPTLTAETPEPVRASVSTLPAPRPEAEEKAAPRTQRLRPETAQALRSAWLHAKRDDVLLSSQDFASNLIEEALASRHRREQRSASAR